MRSKITIFITIAALSLFIACSREKNGVTACDSEQMIGLVVENGGPDTKCSGGYDSDSPLVQDMPYVTENGDTLYISAYLSDMDEPEALDTKGAPITSSLLGTYGDYTDFITRVYPSTGTSCYVSKKSEFDTNPRTMEEATVSYSSSKWNFDNKYYWPNSTDNLYFISIAPKAAWTNGNVFEHKAATCWNNYKYSFKYQTIDGTPSKTTSAEDQYDLLVAYNKQKRSDYESNVHVDFKHACVGVKFIMGNIYGTIGTLALKRFYNEAKITVGDGTLEFSDYSDLENFTQEFNFETSSHKDKDPLDATVNSTKTFMVMPQKLINRGTDPDADLFLWMDGTLHPDSLSFKDLADPSKGGDAKLADWSGYAGKIITFRISSEKANNVSVKITDTVEGKTKKDIVITNDGKSNVMIRVELVGNWLNEDGQVLASWDETNPYGTFTSDSHNGFPNLVSTSNWKKGSDGFYYYKKYLKGKENATVSENLFDTYTVESKPTDATGTWAQGGTKMQIKKMELAILVQAVIAENDLASFKAAWNPNNKIDDIVTWIGTPVEVDE